MAGDWNYKNRVKNFRGSYSHDDTDECSTDGVGGRNTDSSQEEEEESDEGEEKEEE